MDDRAVLLSPQQPNSPALLVSALRRGNGWQLQLLQEFADVRTSFVTTGAPGKYDFFEPSATEAREPGEVLKLHATTDVVIAGTWEASEIVYALEGDKWVHVWIAN